MALTALIDAYFHRELSLNCNQCRKPVDEKTIFTSKLDRITFFQTAL